MRSNGLAEYGGSAIDEIFKNKGRQTIIGTLLTGTGLTIAAAGVAILATRAEKDVPQPEEDEGKTE